MDNPRSTDGIESLRTSLIGAREAAVVRALESSGGNPRRAAALLDVSVSYVYLLLKSPRLRRALDRIRAARP